MKGTGKRIPVKWRGVRWSITMAALAALLAGCSDPESEIAEADYGAAAKIACAAGEKGGAAGATNNERLETGVRYNVRAPANYNPRIAHPLIVVYAPGSRGAWDSESYTQLTKVATAAGFVIAYAGSRPMQVPAIIELGAVSGAVAAKWCIDTARVYFTGHSNGGTISTALALLEETRGTAAAIAPSAAGFTEKDLEDFSCPVPLPVMVMHSKNDHLFPGYGAQAAKWWASCNRCEAEPQALANGCLVYPNCAKGVATLYCEGDGLHISWPDRNATIIDFFRKAGARRVSEGGSSPHSPE
jgi:polyhydroxybutyrate depolymerase